MADFALRLLYNDMFLVTGLNTLLSIPFIARQYLPFVPPSDGFELAQSAGQQSIHTAYREPTQPSATITPTMPEHVTVTITNTVTDIKTTYAESVSIRTQTQFYGIDRTVTVRGSIEPTTPAAFPTAALVDPMPSNSYRESTLSPDALIFWLLIITFAVYCWLMLHNLYNTFREVGTQTEGRQNDEVVDAVAQTEADSIAVNAQTAHKLSLAEQDAEGLRKQLYRMRRELARLRRASRLHKADHIRALNELATIHAQIEGLESTQDKPTTSRAQPEALETLRSQVEDLQQQLDQANKTTGGLERDVQEALANKQSLVDDRHNALQRVIELEHDIEELKRSGTGEPNADEAKRNHEKAALQSEIESLKWNHQHDYNSYRQAIDEHQATIDSLQIKQQNIEFQAQQLLNQSNAENSALKTELERYKSNATSHEASIAQLQASNTNLEASRAKMLNEMQDLQNKLQLRDQEVQSAKEEVWSATNQREAAAAEREALKTQFNKQLEAQMSQGRGEVEREAQDKIDALRAEVEGLKTALQSSKSNATDNFKAYEKAKAEIRPLKEKVGELEERVKWQGMEIENLEGRLAQRASDESLFGEDLACFDN